jgi:hypothetical protein
MIKNDYFIMCSWSYEIVNGEPIFSKPKEIKIPINDILKANGFEPIKENEIKQISHSRIFK